MVFALYLIDCNIFSIPQYHNIYSISYRPQHLYTSMTTKFELFLIDHKLFALYLIDHTLLL